MFPFTQTRKESANAWVNVYMESDHTHTAYRLRMPQPHAAYAYRLYGILALASIICNKNGAFVHITNSSLIVGTTCILNVVKPFEFIFKKLGAVFLIC